MSLPAVHQLDLDTGMLGRRAPLEPLRVGVAGALAAIDGQQLEARLETTDGVEHCDCSVGIRRDQSIARSKDDVVAVSNTPPAETRVANRDGHMERLDLVAASVIRFAAFSRSASGSRASIAATPSAALRVATTSTFTPE